MKKNKAHWAFEIFCTVTLVIYLLLTIVEVAKSLLTSIGDFGLVKTIITVLGLGSFKIIAFLIGLLILGVCIALIENFKKKTRK